MAPTGSDLCLLPAWGRGLLRRRTVARPGPARPGEFLRDGEVRCCPSSRRPPGLALRRPGSFSSKSRCGFYFSFSLYTVSLQNAVDCDLEQANVT